MVLLLALAMSSQAEEVFDGQSYWFGDPHVHTGASGDGGASDLGHCRGDCGAVQELGELALDVGLDWLSVTDHVNNTVTATPEAYAQLLDIQLEVHASGDLVVVPGAELHFFLTGVGPLGHRNLMLFGTDAQLAGHGIDDVRLDGSAIMVDSCEEIFSWLEEVEAHLGPAWLIPHHPGSTLPMAVDWSCHDPTWEPSVEVYSEHGNSMGDGTGFDSMWGEDFAPGQVHRALEMGHHLGFLGGTDRHDTHPGDVCHTDSQMDHHPYGGGLTAVVLGESEALTRTAIYQAFREHRTYATSGPMLPVSVRYASAGAPLGGLGEDLYLAPGQPLELEVELPPEEHEHVVDVVATTPWGDLVLSPTTQGHWEGTLGLAPEWIYVRVELDGSTWFPSGCSDGGTDQREMIWLSPSWVYDGPGDLDGDGQTWAEGDCDDGDASTWLGAEELCDRPGDYDCDGLQGLEDPDCLSIVDLHPSGPDYDPTHDRLDTPEGPEHPSDLADELSPAQRPAGCATTPAGAAWLWLAIPVLWSRRRSRRARAS